MDSDMIAERADALSSEPKILFSGSNNSFLEGQNPGEIGGGGKGETSSPSLRQKEMRRSERLEVLGQTVGGGRKYLFAQGHWFGAFPVNL